MSFELYGYCIMEWGLNELRSLWDRPLADTKSRSVEAFAWHDPGDSALLTPTGYPRKAGHPLEGSCQEVKRPRIVKIFKRVYLPEVTRP
jgi:hypothetical protein